jgi:HSP20 family protein
MMVRRPSPFGELISLRRTMDRVFDDPFFQTIPLSRGVRRMPLDVLDTPDSLILEAALPGVRPEDIEVSVLDDELTLAAGSEDQQSTDAAGYQVREVRRGRVSRTVTLPHGLRTSEATASFENGLLRLTIPKAQLIERRVIPITVAAPVAQVVDAGNGAAAVTEGLATSSEDTPSPDATGA